MDQPATPTPDAIVIGAGQNGLTCACYLARAGLRVLVLEAYQRLGGMTLTEELTLPGFWSDMHASGSQLANLSPVPAELELAQHGLQLIVPDKVYAHAFPGGQAIVVSRDLERAVAAIAAVSPRDAATFRALLARYHAGREDFTRSFFSPPVAAPPITTGSSAASYERARFGLQSLRSWADQTFESETVKTLFGGFAAFVGAAPDDAGGAEIGWLFGAVLQAEGNNLVRGGMNGVTRALAADLAAHGGVVRTGATVAKIAIASGRATGVELETGETIAVRRLVVSATDPAQLALRFLGEAVVGPDIASAMRQYEWGDAVMTIYLALDGPVDYAAGPQVGETAQVHLSPASLASLAQASLECRAGLLPAEPFIVAWNDSAIDPSRAPAGKALKKLVVLGVPYHICGDASGKIKGTTWEEARDPYADHVIDLVAARYLPGLRERLLRWRAHSPLDLERTLASAVHGTLAHGAMLPYQMGVMRPIPELAGYRSPVPTVYLCDSGTHPGPGVSMGSGRNAASVILDDLGVAFPTPGN
jgi:phytoene dehydrogenase-like protein